VARWTAPFVILFEQEGAASGVWRLVGEDTDDVGPTFDFADRAGSIGWMSAA